MISEEKLEREKGKPSLKQQDENRAGVVLEEASQGHQHAELHSPIFTWFWLHRLGGVVVT